MCVFASVTARETDGIQEKSRVLDFGGEKVGISAHSHMNIFNTINNFW